MKRRIHTTLLAAAVSLSWATWIAPAWGHGLDPALLSLTGNGSGQFAVTWRTAAARLPGADVQPLLPARCRQVGASTSEVTLEHVTLRWSIDCGPKGLAGETIGVQDLDAARINTLLRIAEPGRSTIQLVLNPRRSLYVVPAMPARYEVLRDYATLGIEHMLTGTDHLLFIFGLLLLLPSVGLLIKTVTAFTLGHSLTLSAAAFGVAAAPSHAIEILIALSVLFLAVELTRDDTAADATLVRRFPWLIAATFGLLHGFAFAGVLSETGLATADTPIALLAFNSGIEIGQLLFIAVVLSVSAIGHRWLPNATHRVRATAVYAMGILAVYWILDRAVTWLA